MSTLPINKKADWQKAVYIAIVAFVTYASVYAYRKPFTVASFEGISFWGVPYQTLLIISQGVGYMLSKFTGIKFIAELGRKARWKPAVLLIGTSWLALLIFGLIPAPYGMLCLLVNGFCLGFLWGIVFSYVEGRRTTDFIGAAMAVSFIFAGGFTRSVAVWLRDAFSIPDVWIGAATGLVFFLPLALFFFLLERVPAPSEEDVAERQMRIPMSREQRRKILQQFGLGLLMVTITYVLLTVMRDIRDNFMSNMWNELGYGKKPEKFTQTETITSIIVLTVMCMLVLIRNSFKTFFIIHAVVAVGFIIAAGSSIAYFQGWISGAAWMQGVGLGLYMGYIPFNCIFFERFISAFKIAGNVGFLMYIADAFGYMGSMTVMLTKEIARVQMNWVNFYGTAVIIAGVLGLAGVLGSYIYFKKQAILQTHE